MTSTFVVKFGHKNLKKSPSCFDKSADLLSKRQNKREIFSNFVAFSQCLNFTSKIFEESEKNILIWGKIWKNVEKN